jgi:hypothetical protein
LVSPALAGQVGQSGPLSGLDPQQPYSPAAPLTRPPGLDPDGPHLPIATQAGGGGPRPDGSRDPDDVHMHICTGDEPLRGGLVASGLLFGAQHMQALPSYHPLPSGLPLCMCMCMCMCTCICICICICMCVCASVCRADGAAAAASVTGFAWGVLYVGSGNLFSSSPTSSSTPCVEHARVPRLLPRAVGRCSYVSPL